MKAFMSIATEIDADLTDNEITNLRNETIVGKIKVREYDGPNPERDLEIRVGEVEFNEYLGLESFPKEGFEKITKYVVILTELGYENLVKRDGVVDRPGIFAKVTVSRMKYQPKPLNTS